MTPQTTPLVRLNRKSLRLEAVKTRQRRTQRTKTDTYLIEECDLEFRDRGVGSIVNTECDASIFRERVESLENSGRISWPPQEYAKKILEPILQIMMVKEKERREAHLHEIRITATCVDQLVEKEANGRF